jgi:N-acetylglucosamine kinase-like BadF-type ATPase
MDTAIDNIVMAADGALAQVGLGREAIGGWGLGLGGVCSPSESADVEAALRARLGEGPRLVAVEDVVSAWSGAFGGEVGELPRAVCIAGTGANCWGQNGRGETASADGLGPLLGDRGSGYWIGEAALRHAGRVADGVVPADDFAAAVLAHFEAEDIKALIRLVYAPDFQRSAIAGLVPVVLAHAQSGAARGILEAAGREMAATALAVLRQLSGEGEVRGEVALIGGVLAYAEPMTSAFNAVLAQEAPGVRLVEAKYEPAVGAALLV